jgi:hypothetical protein
MRRAMPGVFSVRANQLEYLSVTEEILNQLNSERRE